jgi:hypothetical protein
MASATLAKDQGLTRIAPLSEGEQPTNSVDMATPQALKDTNVLLKRKGHTSVNQQVVGPWLPRQDHARPFSART